MNIIVNEITTAVACIRSDRNYIGFEKDTNYFEKSLIRINNEFETK